MLVYECAVKLVYKCISGVVQYGVSFFMKNHNVIFICYISVLILSVADNNSKEELIQYRLPVTHLQPFHHYHLEMIMVYIR